MPPTKSPSPKARAAPGRIRPDGMGRPRVRFMTASTSRSTHWFSARAPAVASPVPTMVWMASPSSSRPREATKAVTPAVIMTYPAIPGLVSS